MRASKERNELLIIEHLIARALTSWRAFYLKYARQETYMAYLNSFGSWFRKGARKYLL